jgi:hypothetical protein
MGDELYHVSTAAKMAALAHATAANRGESVYYIPTHLRPGRGGGGGGGPASMARPPVTRIPVSTTDPAPSALPAAPYDYYGANVLMARAVALPRADRPKQFIIADGIRGPLAGDYTNPTADPLTLSCAIETMALLGMNTLEITLWGSLNATAMSQAAGWGIARFLRFFFAPPSYFSYEPATTPTAATTWAYNLAQVMANEIGYPLAQVALISMADEPGWYYPGVVTDAVDPSGRWSGLESEPTAVAAFQSFLAAQGFTPADFGGAVWTDVQPTMISGVTTVESARRYVWTARFVADAFAEGMRIYRTALEAEVNGTVLTASNFNNALSRWFIPSPGQTIINNPDTGPDAAYGSLHWLTYGAAAATTALWTEDWVNDVESQIWSLMGDMLRCGAHRGGTTFGGYIVGRGLHGFPAGGCYKALALLGRGAKALMWYVHGPAEAFPGNGWSYSEPAYGEIAAANRLIARAEDLLYPGQPTPSRIALIYPVTSWLWDGRAPEMGDSAVAPLFQEELTGLHYAFAHSGCAVDFLSEDDVVAHLNEYALCYVVIPNLAAAAQTALAAWIAAGGVAWFGPGAAACDEYNQPCTILNAARGVTVQIMPRQGRGENDDPAHTVGVTTLQVPINGVILAPLDWDNYSRQQERLTVTTATTVATYRDDDSPAIVFQATGAGFAITSGVWAGTMYYHTGNWGDLAHLPTAWEARRRGIVTAPRLIAGVTPPVSCDQPMVELLRLDSVEGIAVTCVNWADQVPLAALTLTVRDCPTITRLVLAATLTPVAYTQVGSTVTVTLPLATVDVVKLYR